MNRKAYDEAIKAHNLAAQANRFAQSEFLSGRISEEAFMLASKAERRALENWEQAYYAMIA